MNYRLPRFNHLVYALRVIDSHPLTSKKRLPALRRWLSWQVGSRLVPGPVVVPFVNDTRLLVKPGMHGATLNVYVGLNEFSDMAFLLHFLRAGDLFVDVGANVGAYTVLASGAIGCRAIAFEPTPEAFDDLQANVRLNGVEERVQCLRAAVGQQPGTIQFTRALDTLNHVVGTAPAASAVAGVMEVEVTTLDTSLAGREPALMKIDVEGYEFAVIAGGRQTLSNPSLQAIIIEINEYSERYGVERDQTYDSLVELGFTACTYDPFTRELVELRKEVWHEMTGANSIFIRDLPATRARVRTADSFRVIGVTL